MYKPAAGLFVFILATFTTAAQTLTITTLAGSTTGGGHVDGTGTDARFGSMNGVAADAAGNVYVADTGSNTIRKVSAGGVVTTIAGRAWEAGTTDGTASEALFNEPTGITLDGSGNLYVTDHGSCTIRKITPAGMVTTIAGRPGIAGVENGTTATATFRSPEGIVLDAAGNLFVADTEAHIIRRITPSGEVTTFAGSGKAGEADGSAREAWFYRPAGLTIDRNGMLIVSDRGGQAIRKVSPSGVVTTLVGSGPYFASQWFWNLAAVVADPGGDIYAVDSYSVKKVDPVTGVVTAVVPDGQFPFAFARGITRLPDGTLIVADAGRFAVDRVTTSGVVSPYVGSPIQYGVVDGKGLDARFYGPDTAAIDAAGNVIVAEASSAVLRKMTPDGVVTTIAGRLGETGPRDGPGSSARFTQPNGAATDGSGDIYVADGQSIRRIASDGVVSTFASGSYVDSNGLSERFGRLTDIARDRDGNLYVIDAGSPTVRKITPAKAISTLAGAVAGHVDAAGTAARFWPLARVAVDAAGNVYVDEASSIRKITPAGEVTTLAGTFPPNGPKMADGVSKSAVFELLNGMTATADGTLFVADAGAIRMISPTGVVKTLAGSHYQGNVDGAGSEARLQNAAGIGILPDGRLVIADTYNANIRIGTFDKPIAGISVSPAVIVPGAPATLAWSVTGPADGAKFSIDNGVGTVARTGYRTVNPVGTTTYTFTVTSADGTRTQSSFTVVVPTPKKRSARH